MHTYLVIYCYEDRYYLTHLDDTNLESGLTYLANQGAIVTRIHNELGENIFFERLMKEED